MRKEESTKTLEDALLNPNNKQNSHIDVSTFFEEHKDSFLSPLTPFHLLQANDGLYNFI